MREESPASASALAAGAEPVQWQSWGHYTDIGLERSEEGIARICINRPEKRNAFRPRTVQELCDAFSRVRDDPSIGVVLFTGAGPAADGVWSFCAGSDQRVRGEGGYVDDQGLPRLNVLDLQRLIRSLPKVVIALVARVGSFDGGFGAGYLARVVGQRKAREIWFLCRRYGAQEALAMGLVNQVVPLNCLQTEGVAWAREVLRHSPTAIRCLKAAFNAETDGLAGIQELAGQATHLFYRTAEGQEGRNAFLEKRDPDFSDSPWLP